MMRRFPVRRRRDQWQFFESRLYLGLLPLLTGTLANGKDFFPFLVLLLVSNYQLSRSSLESDKGPWHNGPTCRKEVPTHIWGWAGSLLGSNQPELCSFRGGSGCFFFFCCWSQLLTITHSQVLTITEPTKFALALLSSRLCGWLWPVLIPS